MMMAIEGYTSIDQSIGKVEKRTKRKQNRNQIEKYGRKKWKKAQAIDLLEIK